MDADFELTKFNKELGPNKFKKDRAIITVNLGQFKMGRKQKERMKFLAEHRYDIETQELRINVQNFVDCEDNQTRAVEILKELMLEALRAPLD